MSVGYTQREIDFLHAISHEKFEKDLYSNLYNAEKNGRMEERIKTLKGAMSLGLPLDIITKLTGFSESEIKTLSSEN
jgi:hypothetical protein